jgi:hypothetical protein
MTQYATKNTVKKNKEQKDVKKEAKKEEKDAIIIQVDFKRLVLLIFLCWVLTFFGDYLLAHLWR